MKSERISILNSFWILVFLTTTIYTSSHYKWDQEIIVSDGKGYYAYLPWFFEGVPIDSNEVFVNKIGDAHISKYYSGTALLISPFYLGAQLYCKIVGHEGDKFSKPFQLAVNFAATFYALFGLIAIYLLLGYYKISYHFRILTLLLFYYGTNLFYYTTIDCSFSHIYSFAIVSLFLLFFKTFLNNFNSKYLYISAVFFGLIILIRPTNGVILCTIPFLAGTSDKFKILLHYLHHRKVQLIFIALISGLIFFIQPLIWFSQTGEWIFRSYVNEGFYFTSPHFLDVLFSFRKGLFIYTPLLLIPVVFLFSRIKKYPFESISGIGFFIILTYLISSWWNWAYANSFGQRAFIEFYPLFIIPLALGLQSLKKVWHFILVITLASYTLTLNLIQSYQYFHRIIHPADMNFERYKFVFLETGEAYHRILGGLNDIPFYAPNGKKLVYSTKISFEKGEVKDWKMKNVQLDSSSKNHFDYFKGEEHRAVLILNENNLPHSGNLFVKVSLKRIEFSSNSSSHALFTAVAHNKSTNENCHYSAFFINDFPDDNQHHWREFNYAFNMHQLPENDQLEYRFAIWNSQKQSFGIDDIHIDIYAASK